jgi:hypothetical protein
MLSAAFAKSIPDMCAIAAVSRDAVSSGRSGSCRTVSTQARSVHPATVLICAWCCLTRSNAVLFSAPLSMATAAAL